MSNTFTIRKRSPRIGDKYIDYYNNKIYYPYPVNGKSTCCAGYNNITKESDPIANVLPNCVGYACGRFNEIYSEINNIPKNSSMRYPFFNGNAGGFIVACRTYYPELKYALGISAVPSPGAIVVLCNGGNPLTNISATGHVFIVEQVLSDTEIFVSESGYSNENSFWNSVWHKRNDGCYWDNPGNWYSNNGYTFVGFIYNPAVDGSTIPSSAVSSYASLKDITIEGNI